MSGTGDVPIYQSADFERVPWTAVVPAILCAITALVSAVVLAVGVFNGFREDRAVTFFAVPTTLFDGSSGWALASYLIFVVPWTIAMTAACRRLFFPQRDAHRLVTVLLVPALALDVIAYASIVSAGRPLADANLPFGLWLIIGVVALAFLATRRTRQFEASPSYQQTSWYDADSDDGT